VDSFLFPIIKKVMVTYSTVYPQSLALKVNCRSFVVVGVIWFRDQQVVKSFKHLTDIDCTLLSALLRVFGEIARNGF
jgi:uncharacterized membrane protein